MKKNQKILSRYRWSFALLACHLSLFMLRPGLGLSSLSLTGKYVWEMLSVVPPVFLIMGLMDVWIPKEMMMKYMGKGAGLKGGVFAFSLGAFSSGPLYAAFPVAGMFLKKGVSLGNVFLFLGAWSTTKIPMALFEATQLGSEFAGMRFVLNTLGIILLALIMEKTTGRQEQEAICQRAQEISEK